MRPENLEDAALAPPDRPRLRGRIRLRESLGSEVMAHIEVAAHAAETEELEELAHETGGRSAPARADGGTAVVVGRFDPHSRAKAGDTVEIAVDTRSLHFFDAETGLGIYRDENDEGGRT